MSIEDRDICVNELADKNEWNEELSAIGKNLSALMLKKNVETKTLSAFTGISVSLLNALKRGKGNPTLGTLITLANYFDVSVDELMSSKKIATHEAVKIIPVYSLQDVHNLNAVKSQQNIYLQITDAQDGKMFAVVANNSSMLPFFDKGSTFVISADKKYTDGDIVLVRINNERNVLRKVFLVNKGLLFQTISIGAESLAYDHYQVIGTVTKVIHDLGRANE